ncbi:lysophospholipid acyltransferase family protein [Pararhodobacter zhoushanensis]|uniref:lysophospholipid acyltransferase family protein n=1 Tax=Pararhodobacter zhoushanensis TaxID=2479545 RepID=UPI000F8F644E|nr:lysophospholipid acyltransferase family protein [Pararhodobacter zhoushanensis]
MTSTHPLRRFAARVTGQAIVLFARAITAVHADWRGVGPSPRQRVYFANHVSNADMPMIWSVLPHHMRLQTRPVAAADYWLKSKLRAFAGGDVFRAVLIDRRPDQRTDDPMAAINQALSDGDSLIIFPEGLRNQTAEPLLPFKSGLYNMAKAHPGVELVPTWIANLNSVMPKGEVIPLPLMCKVIFGEPVALAADEERAAFLSRAAAALLALKPEERA